MKGLVKQFVDGAYRVYAPEGIQLSVKKRTGKDSYYVYYHRKQVSLSEIPELSTATYPVYFDYVFGEGWRRYTNEWYNQLLK